MPRQNRVSNGSRPRMGNLWRGIKIRRFNQIKKILSQITPQNKLYCFSEKTFKQTHHIFTRENRPDHVASNLVRYSSVANGLLTSDLLYKGCGTKHMFHSFSFSQKTWKSNHLIIVLWRFGRLCWNSLIVSLRSYDGCNNENVTLK